MVRFSPYCTSYCMDWVIVHLKLQAVVICMEEVVSYDNIHRGGLKWMDYLFFFGINLFFCFETSQSVWFQWEVWILLFLMHLRVLGDVVSIFVFNLNSIKHFTISHHCNFNLITPEVDCSILWGTKEILFHFKMSFFRACFMFFHATSMQVLEKKFLKGTSFGGILWS